MSLPTVTFMEQLYRAEGRIKLYDGAITVSSNSGLSCKEIMTEFNDGV